MFYTTDANSTDKGEMGVTIIDCFIAKILFLYFYFVQSNSQKIWKM